MGWRVAHADMAVDVGWRKAVTARKRVRGVFERRWRGRREAMEGRREAAEGGDRDNRDGRLLGVWEMIWNRDNRDGRLL